VDLKQWSSAGDAHLVCKNDPRLKTELEALVGEVIYNPTASR